MQNNTELYTGTMLSQENARFMSRVYGWMLSGLALTALVAFYASQSLSFMEMITTNRGLFYILMFAELGCVLLFTFLLPKLSAFAATALYFTYAALTGLTLSVLSLIYTGQSIAQVFVLTTVSFAGLSGFGFVTKRDLGPVGSFCVMGLFGMIGYGLLTMIFPSMYSKTGDLVFGIIGVIVFSGLTAYDTQRIKQMNVPGTEGSDENKKVAIHGALALYLDFINLFLSLLRIFGRSRD